MNFEAEGLHSDYVDGDWWLPLAQFRYYGAGAPNVDIDIEELGPIGQFCLNFWAGVFEFGKQYSPDLYGPLDLAGTSTYSLSSSDFTIWQALGGEENAEPAEWSDGWMDGSTDTKPISTHITRVDVSDCRQLTYVDFTGQKLCTEFRALNCPRLSDVELKDCDYRLIDLEMENLAGRLTINAVGDGSVGMEYAVDRMTKYKLYATEHENGHFVGWYKNGKCLSTDAEAEFDISEVGEITAVFGGDANNDGLLDMSDALLIIRDAMELLPGDELSFCDLDASGSIDMTDAILVMRLALGVYLAI